MKYPYVSIKKELRTERLTRLIDEWKSLYGLPKNIYTYLLISDLLTRIFQECTLLDRKCYPISPELTLEYFYREIKELKKNE